MKRNQKMKTKRAVALAGIFAILWAGAFGSTSYSQPGRGTGTLGACKITRLFVGAYSDGGSLGGPKVKWVPTPFKAGDRVTMQVEYLCSRDVGGVEVDTSFVDIQGDRGGGETARITLEKGANQYYSPPFRAGHGGRYSIRFRSVEGGLLTWAVETNPVQWVSREARFH